MKFVLSLLIIFCHISFAESYFSMDYVSARNKFRTFSEDRKNKNTAIETGFFAIPSRVDSDLTLDFTFIPPKKNYETLLIVTSGVHGPEGFAGSAVQSLLLQTKLKNLDRTGVLLVHSLNPYGFKYKRRVTENNVDLNRNFDANTEIFKTPNPLYQRVSYIVERPEVVTSLTEIWAKTLFHFLSQLMAGMSLSDLVQAVGQGQYGSPQGLYYGGTDFEPQVSFFSDLILHYGRLFNRVALIDFHTGIGKKGELKLMSGRFTDDIAWAKILKYFPQEKKGYYNLYNGTVGAFFYIYGDIVDLIPSLFGSKVAFSFTAEYGTMGNSFPNQISSISRMITERAGFYNGYKNSRIKSEAQKDFMEVFNPTSTSWQNTILQKSTKLIDQALTGLEKL